MNTGTCNGGCVRVRLRCPHQLLVVCTHFGSSLKKQNKKIGLVSFYTKPIFCVLFLEQRAEMGTYDEELRASEKHTNTAAAARVPI